MQIANNILNLPNTVSQVGTTKAVYKYTADGTKYQVAENASANSNGLVYLGSLIFSKNGSTYAFESTDFGGGRIINNGSSISPYYYTADHLGSIRTITNNSGTIVEQNDYYPFGLRTTTGNSYATFTANRYKYNGKEKQTVGNTGYIDYGSRMYDEIIGRWGTVDLMAEKMYNISSYGYVHNNPVRYIDPVGMIWKDAVGNKIEDHIKIKVYIFYDPKSFGSQSQQMYKDAVAKYGEESVAMSNVITMSEFAQDWNDMASGDIKEVNLNYHGNNQTVMLNSNDKQYITATGDGKTNRSGTKATNVQDLPTPAGNIDNAQLNINTCQSNSKTQYELKGNKQTLMESFFNSFNFKIVRGTDKSVSYWYWFSPNRPHPRDDSNWQYIHRPSSSPTKYPGVGLPPK